MSKTSNTITRKQENKGMRGILDLTSTLGQCLKQFDGICTKQLPECDGLTVEGWMSAHGVERFVTPGGKKKGYTPGLIAEGWHDGMKEDKTFFLFRNRVAKYSLKTSDADGAWHDKTEQERLEEKYYRVFTKEEAEKIDGKAISRYMLDPIRPNQWSVAKILKGLKQGLNFQKEEERMLVSEIEWDKIDHVYIVRYDKVDGEIVRRVIEVEKENVEF